jgi:hypothetical protein
MNDNNNTVSNNKPINMNNNDKPITMNDNNKPVSNDKPITMNDNNKPVSNDKPITMNDNNKKVSNDKKVKKVKKVKKTNNTDEQNNNTDEQLSREENLNMKIKLLSETYELIFRSIISNSIEDSDINTRPINIDDCNFLLNKAIRQIKEGVRLKEMIDLYVKINSQLIN